MRWDVSLGNLLNLVTLGAAVFIAWGVMTERSEATHSGLSSLKTAQSEIEERVRNLETGQASLGAKLDMIQSTLGRIETLMEKRK
jgi:hypothetical protein